MMRAAWFWILLIFSILVLAVVPHAAMPYSRTGLALPACSLFRVEASAPHVVLASFFMSASRTFALDLVLCVCCFQVSRLSKVTPRYVGLSYAFRVWFPSRRVTFCSFGERLKTVYVVLVELTFTDHFLVPLSRTSSACCIL